MPKNIWLLIIGTAISITAASFVWPLNAIYMHDELGKSLTFAGMILMFIQAFGVIGNLIGGVLFDKLGGFKTIMSGATITMVAACLLAIFNTIVPYAILLMIIGLGSGIIMPAVYAMASSVWPEGGRRAFNSIYVAQNFGVALGSSIGGFIAAFSFSYIFIANALLFIVFFSFAFITYKSMSGASDPQAYTSVFEQKRTIKDKTAFRALLLLSGGFLICWIGYVQWQSTIAPYTQELGISLSKYSLLWTINGALIVLGQPLLKLITTRIQDPKKQIYLGNTIFIISFIVLLFADSFSVFALAMIILTIGEMLVWPAVPTLANNLAPKGRIGFYQGIINSVGTAGRMIGPVLGGIIVDNYAIHFLFYFLLFLYLIPYITTFIYDRRVVDKYEEKQGTEV
ncbi:MFS transporter [Aquibacillus halophilus]|uniref:MFS transporter n=1 Tax=Aquibacillus halophilus TaxID=930132 RepID=A0A6A8DE14_9BACI|nr:MFS transporter [Aquibacillus halophilus]MRH42756.1 MFS transporter [Aquibacillus halophilus]